MRNWTKAAAMIIPAAFAIFASPARATESDEYAPPAIIEKRAYLPHHEFRLAMAYLPQDPFWKAYGPDFSYTWHPSEYWSWEVVRAAYFTTYNSSLRKKLASEFDKTQDPYEKASYLVASNLQLTPFYGRYTVMNRAVVHQETYLAAGVSADGWTKPQDPKVNGGGVRPGFDVGLGFRWYTSRKTSLKLEVLDNFFMRSDGSVGDQVWLTLGMAFSVPR